MQAAGVEFSLDSRDPPQPEAVRRATLRRYQQRVATAAQQPRASQLRHYFVTVRPSCLEDGGLGKVAHCWKMAHESQGPPHRSRSAWGAQPSKIPPPPPPQPAAVACRRGDGGIKAVRLANE
ncbi:hypothetical protein ACK3TF_000382 [Chlorella vulgaris]